MAEAVAVVVAVAVAVVVDVVVQGGKGGGCLLLSWSCVFFSLSREASKFLYNIRA